MSPSMAFKFSIGQAVEYRPRYEAAGLFKVIRHMPREDQAIARRYLIKSQQEGFERIVHEFDLQSADADESIYDKPAPTRRER